MMTAEMKKRNTNDISIEEISAGFGLAASGTAPTAKYKAGDKVWYLQGWGMGIVESAELIDHPIIVLDEGKIVEDGTYTELMEKNGFFTELVKRQQIGEGI